MTTAVLAAGFATSGAVGTGYVVPRRLTPSLVARFTTALSVAAAGAFIWTLLLLAGTGIAQVHGVAERLTLCNDYVVQHGGSLTPPALGAISVLAVVGASLLVARRRQRVWRAAPNSGGLTVVPSDDPNAFALPGHPGQIVVTTGMLRSLDPAGRRVLLAHEKAHLRLHHHRYVRATQLATAALPVLRPMVARVRFATERWADEEAALEVGDRALVAQTIARAALAASPAVSGAMAFTHGDVVARVEAMLDDPPRRARGTGVALAAGSAVFAAAIGSSIVFMHHWMAAALGYCL